MIVGSSDDFSMKRMVSRDVNSAVIPNETIVHLHAMVMVKGADDGVIPKVDVSGGGFYALMGLLNGWHDHSFEVFW